MGKSKQNGNFDSQASRGMHRSEDDLGYLDPDLSDDTMITPDTNMPAGQTTAATTATMQAQTKKIQPEKTSLEKKRSNQPDR